MKLNDRSYSIKVSLVGLVFIFCFSSCNKTVRKVEVTVYNVSTGKGIEGIRLFYDDETYSTDSEGKAEIKKWRNIRDDIVSTEPSILNFGYNAVFVHLYCFISTF